MELLKASSESALVIITKYDISLLSAALRETDEALFGQDYAQRTGYPQHSFQYLDDELGKSYAKLATSGATFDLGQDTIGIPNKFTVVVSPVGPKPPKPTADGLLEREEVADIDDSLLYFHAGLRAVLWEEVLLAPDSLRILSTAITECLKHFEDDQPPYDELPTRTGYQVEEFQTVQKQIQDILAAIEAAPTA